MLYKNSDNKNKEKEKLAENTTRQNREKKVKNIKDRKTRQYNQLFSSGLKYGRDRAFEDEEIDTGIKSIKETTRAKKVFSFGKSSIKSIKDIKDSKNKAELSKSKVGTLKNRTKDNIKHYSLNSLNENLRNKNQTDDISSDTLAEINKGRMDFKKYNKNKKIYENFKKGKEFRQKRVLKKARKKIIKSVNLVGSKIASILSSKSILLILLPLLIIPIIVASVSGLFSSSSLENEYMFAGEISLTNELPMSVMKWEPDIIKELKKYNLEQYTDLLLVIINLESRGNKVDVMQSSESLGLAPNSISSTKESIEAGVLHFKKSFDEMNKYGTDIKSLIQAYNYGSHFIPYVAKNGGTWNQELANSFSDIQAKRLGWDKYGDRQYVMKSMKYLTIKENEVLFNEEFIASGELGWPVPNHTYISSPFGTRIHPIFKTEKFHTGIDIPAPTGTPILSAGSGVVIESGTKGGYGKTIVIDHGEGIKTLYAHNSKLSVKVGQKVKKGDLIARAGSTGYSTGPHCHFEVRKNNKCTNPMDWLN